MLTYPNIDPVALSLGPLKVHWYGLMYLVGFVGAWALGRYRAAKPDWPLSPLLVDDLIFYGALGVILGGRIGYMVFYQAPELIHHPLTIFQVWDGGMSFHGGLIGVMTAMALFARKYKLHFFTLMDFIAPLVPIGLFAGRIGNFINGELWGRPTDLPWGMVFPQAADGIARHPSQLYQFAGEGLLLFAIVWLFALKPRAVGAVSAVFLIGYGTLRFLAEFTREPDSFLGLLGLGLSMGQWLSLPMIVVGMWMYRWAQRAT